MDPSHDLRCPKAKAKLRKEIDAATALCIATACDSWSRARCRQLPGVPPEEKPCRLRSERHPRGLPHLSRPGFEDQLKYVEEANALADFLGALLC